MQDDTDDPLYLPTISEEDTDESDECESEAEFENFKFEISLRYSQKFHICSF